MSSPDSFRSSLGTIFDLLNQRHETLTDLPTLPPSEAVASTLDALPVTLSQEGLGTTGTVTYLLEKILPGCLQAQNGPNYFGFVTGGVTPAAQLADILGSGYDENVQVTLPSQTAATGIEARGLELILDLLGIERDVFQGRTITTGATASNVLGMGMYISCCR